MGKAILIFMILIMTISVVAMEYEYKYNAYTSRLDRTRDNNQSDQNWSFSSIKAKNISGTMSWINLTDYPVACPNGFAINQLNDNITCISVSTSSVNYWNLSNSNVVLVNTSNNVGIGTNIPGYNLEVNGTVYFNLGEGTTINTFNDNVSFDNLLESPIMSTNMGNAAKIDGFEYDNSTVEGSDHITSGSWCDNSAYYSWTGVDLIEYFNVSALTSLSNFSIVLGIQPYDNTDWGGIISLYSDNQATHTGWTIRTRNDGYFEFRYDNGTDTEFVKFDENGHTGFENNTNYTLVFTYDGDYFRAWVNNIQVEKHTYSGNVIANESSTLKLGVYNTGSNSRYSGEIHFFQIYNYSLTPYQVINRTEKICNNQEHPLTTQRYGRWSLTNNTLANWSDQESLDRIVDPFNFRQFSSHNNNNDFHRGFDLGNATCLPIYSAMNGTIVQIENESESNNTQRSRFGNWLMIEHTYDPDTGQPRHTAYMHMNNTCSGSSFPYGLSETDTVGEGQIIGYTGKTGSDIIKSHVHVEFLRDLNEDTYGNYWADNPLNIFNYSKITNKTITKLENSTHHIIQLSEGFNDLDFYKIKFEGDIANRTVDYESKKGLNNSEDNVSYSDATCYNDVCFYPFEWNPPYNTYQINFTISKSVLGNLTGAIVKGLKGDYVYSISTTNTSTSSGNFIFDTNGRIGIGTSSPNEKLTVVGNVNITGNITTNQFYGGMWYHNSTGTTLSFAVQDTWYPLFYTDATDLNGFSYVGGFGSSSNLTAQVSGKYHASYMAIGSGQNNHIYLTTILVNGIEKPECGNHHKMAAGGDVLTQSGVCIITINIGDTVQVATQDMGGTGNGVYYGGNLNLIRIGN